VRTPLLVEILLARAHHRELELRPNARGAFGAFTLDVGESLEFESGIPSKATFVLSRP